MWLAGVTGGLFLYSEEHLSKLSYAIYVWKLHASKALIKAQKALIDCKQVHS